MVGGRQLVYVIRTLAHGTVSGHDLEVRYREKGDGTETYVAEHLNKYILSTQSKVEFCTDLSRLPQPVNPLWTAIWE